MTNMDHLLTGLFQRNVSLSPEALTGPAEENIHISDPRIARLLLALHEIDVWARDQKTIPEEQIDELIGTAIVACGFTDPAEAQSTVASILDAMWPSGRGYS